MANSYTINVFNNTHQNGNATIFRQYNKEQLSLAWLAQEANAQTKSTFTWQEEFSFVWGDYSADIFQKQFKPKEMVAALPTGESSIKFSNKNNSFHFEDLQAKDSNGSLVIGRDIVQNDLVWSHICVGIAVSQKPSVVIPLNLNPAIKNGVSFSTKPKFILSFGNYIEGQATDPNSGFANTPFEFPSGVFEINAILNSNGTWTINPVH